MEEVVAFVFVAVVSVLHVVVSYPAVPTVSAGEAEPFNRYFLIVTVRGSLLLRTLRPAETPPTWVQFTGVEGPPKLVDQTGGFELADGVLDDGVAVGAEAEHG